MPEPLSDVLYTLGDIGFYVALAGILAFVISYSQFFNWRLRPAGRAIFYTFLALGSLILLAVLGAVFGPGYFGREILRLVISWSIALSVARLVWVLWRSWGRGEKPLDIPEREHKRPTTGPNRTVNKED